MPKTAVIRKVLIITLIAGLIIPACFAAPVSFTDVGTHWASSYINFAAEKEMINGYPVGNGKFTFKPENSVTHEEAITMIYRTLEVAGKLKSTEDFSIEYEEVLTKNLIAPWAKKYVAYGLKYGLIEESEIVGFNKPDGYGFPAKRIVIGAWVAKTLSTEDVPAISLPYEDAATISTDDQSFVEALYRNGIMTGDDKNNFNANSNVKRAEFAAVCNRLYDNVSGGSTFTAYSVFSLSGTFKSYDSGKNQISLTASDGTVKYITLNEKAEVVIDGSIAYNNINSIKSGSTVVISWGVFQGKTPQIIIQTDLQVYVGDVTGIEVLNNDYSLITIENAEGEDILYLKTSDTDGGNSLAVSKNINFICDGVKLLEVQ